MNSLLRKVFVCGSMLCASAAQAAPSPGCQAPTADSPLMLQGCEVGDRLLLRGVQFATDQELILAQSTPLLEQVAAELGANPSIQVAIQGHTDAIGDAAYNQELSQRRAAAVQSFLLARGVHPEQLQARGYGQSQPLLPNDTAAGRAQNRRVELQMVGTRNPVASAPPPPQKVYISTFSAYPSTLTVPVGTTVTWHNFSETSHDVTFADASLGRIWAVGTPALPWGGSTVSRTFDTPGTYAYRCSVTNSVNGKIIVEATDTILRRENPAFAGQTTVNLSSKVRTEALPTAPSSPVPQAMPMQHGAASEMGSDHGAMAAAPAKVMTAARPAAPTIKAGGSVVTIEGRAFNPQRLQVVAGSSVTWSHQGSSLHKISMGTEEGEVMTFGDSYSKVFTAPGEYPYQCGIHPSMTGTITVIEG